jgi:hypothetical protein
MSSREPRPHLVRLSKNTAVMRVYVLLLSVILQVPALLIESILLKRFRNTGLHESDNNTWSVCSSVKLFSTSGHVRARDDLTGPHGCKRTLISRRKRHCNVDVLHKALSQQKRQRNEADCQRFRHMPRWAIRLLTLRSKKDAEACPQEPLLSVFLINMH